jgi:ketosteroid isomerase-like protein
MSEENVDAVKRAFEAIADRSEDFFGILDEDIVWVPGRLSPSGTIYGLDGVRDLLRSWVGTFENYGSEAVECLDAGSSVYVHTRTRGRGKGSGVETEIDQWMVWLFFQGKAVRVTYFPTRAEALEAAGLSE